MKRRRSTRPPWYSPRMRAEDMKKDGPLWRCRRCGPVDEPLLLYVEGLKSSVEPFCPSIDCASREPLLLVVRAGVGPSVTKAEWNGSIYK